MTQRRNQLGQPIGEPVADWTPRAPPPRTPMRGLLCRLEPINAAVHAAALRRARGGPRDFDAAGAQQRRLEDFRRFSR